MSELEGKVALVTGGSRGIGRAIGDRLARQGVSVALAARATTHLGSENTLGIACDVRNRDEVRGAVDAVIRRFGRLDILVVGAGVGSYGPFVEIDPDQLEEIVDVNVKGLLYCVHAALPHLLQRGGDIVTVASDVGRRGLPNQAVYSSSKFAQVGFMRALDNEVRESGVRCTTVCPGGVATDFAMGRGRSPDMPELAAMMKADDVASAVLFALNSPRTHRIMEIAFRPMSERSWG